MFFNSVLSSNFYESSRDILSVLFREHSDPLCVGRGRSHGSSTGVEKKKEKSVSYHHHHKKKKKLRLNRSCEIIKVNFAALRYADHLPNTCGRRVESTLQFYSTCSDKCVQQARKVDGKT